MDHVKHHYAFALIALVIAFGGMLLVRAYTGHATAPVEGGFSFSKAIISVIVLVGCLVFFEEARHK
ncbi:hypothetical protein HN592_04200 [Candidatus Woesearchaeota archaeon]|jgi:hypothetical protein|nr:hypothetical protein [Candidatus Woesearchaeota archaeon]MBT4368414.1 hypothetical protein [Candidatus Woesearchaeota archaeon]MBT4712903.1 hypothetical protein [Candidatus Woesearchaeota archaeon]MBT6639815.1 hypothetical protein [Candidatus Woesearchaeota archaeon]MBT7133987.1 hypothetical protein [Candidatus Woesearchaeota archaeon]